MFAAYIIVTILAAAANLYAASNDFRRVEWVFDAMIRLGVPHSQLSVLGVLKVAGAVGLLVGIGVPAIGVAAAVGLALFFVGAVVTAVRARWYAHLPFPAVWLLLAVGSLVLRLHA
jgi:DoxX-like family